MRNDTTVPFGFPAIARKKIIAAFDGGRLTSDGGVMLLAAAERRLGLADRLAGLIADPRHPLLITHVGCDFVCDVENACIHVTTRVRCSGKTGVEMEALIAASAALLTIYDMTKGVDATLEIVNVRLLEKRGGKSGDFVRMKDEG